MDKGPVTERLRCLRQRAGLSMDSLARSIGYKGASSYQRYEDTDIFKDDFLPLRLVRKLIAVLVGRGSPPITGLEVWALGGIESVKSIYHTTVIGAVQAGVWNNDGSWPDDDQYALEVPVPTEFTLMNRFGLEVRGASMNLVYPAGTVLVCVPLAEVERWLVTGEKIIVQRRGKLGIETTVREFVHDASGVWLWPRSSHPEHQQPIPLSLPRLDGVEQQLAIADFQAVDEEDGVEIAVIALVIQSIRIETMRSAALNATSDGFR